MTTRKSSYIGIEIVVIVALLAGSGAGLWPVPSSFAEPTDAMTFREPVEVSAEVVPIVGGG